MSTFELLLEYADKYTELLAKHTKIKNNMAEKVIELTELYATKLNEKEDWEPERPD